MEHFDYLPADTYDLITTIPPPPPVPTRQQVVIVGGGSSKQLETRLPQWTQTETEELIAARADLDADFMSTKRNKPLWEAVACRLLAAGFPRTADQCKSKWKNLVTRFKGSEGASAMEQEGSSSSSVVASGRQFPFYEAMRGVFEKRMEIARVKGSSKEQEEEEDDGGGGDDQVQVELLQGKEWGEEDADELAATSGGTASKKRKKGVVRDREAGVVAALREFMRRQIEMEERWMEEEEARETERRRREEEWRRSMLSIGEERVGMMRRWREREEARRARADARDERRHQLVVAVLSKLATNLN